MNAKWKILRKKFAVLCILPLAAVAGCVSLNAPDRADNAKGAENMQVRIAEIEVYPEWLDAYLSAAGAVGAESVAKEPGVVCIFPMQRKDNPCLIRIVEIYRSDEAYKEHLATPHFRKYKEGTPHMIKSLELVPMRPLDPGHADTIFKKWLLK
jgi:quinol monooxygenase YgiN